MPARNVFVAAIAVVAMGCTDGDPELNASSRKPELLPHGLAETSFGSEEPHGAIGNWSRLYGDNGNCRASDDRLLLTGESVPRIDWSRKIGSGYSAPVIRDGLLAILHRIGDSEVVTCLDSATGVERWQESYRTSFECDYPTYSSGPYSTPLIDDERVFVLSAEGELRALSIADGSLIWDRELNKEFNVPTLGYGVGHSPVLSQGRLIINVGGTGENEVVVALDPDTGETIWRGGTLRSKRSNGSYGTPVVATIHGMSLVFVVTSEGLMCLRANGGEELWSIPLATNSRDTPNSTTPVVVGDLVMCSMFRADAFCVRIKPDGSHEEVWQNRRSLETCYNPLTCVDGFVYGWHAFDRTFRCVELATGSVRWKERSVFERGNHIAIGDKFLILGELGHVGCVRITPSEYNLLFCTAEPLIEGPCYTSPAYSNQRMYVRNEKQLACVSFAKQPRE